MKVDPRFLDRVFSPFSRRGASTHDICRKANLKVTVAGKLVRRVGNDVRIADRIKIKSIFIVAVPFRVTRRRGGSRGVTRGCSVYKLRLLTTRSGSLGTRVMRVLLASSNTGIAITGGNERTIRRFRDGPRKAFSTVLVSIVVPIVSNVTTAGTVHTVSETSTGAVPVVTVATGTFRRSTGEYLTTNVATRLTGPFRVRSIRGAVIRYYKG